MGNTLHSAAARNTICSYVLLPSNAWPGYLVLKYDLNTLNHSLVGVSAVLMGKLMRWQ